MFIPPLLFFTSFVFILPIKIGHKKKRKDVVIASSLCLATSLANYGIRWKWLQYLDVAVVHTISIYYFIDAVRNKRILPSIIGVCVYNNYNLITKKRQDTLGNIAHAVGVQSLGVCGLIKNMN